MHPKVQSLLKESLEQVHGILKEHFPEDYNAKYKAIISELAKIRHDDADPKGFKYFGKVIHSLDKVADFPISNFPWLDSIGHIAFLMNETDPLYSSVETEKAEQAEEVYAHLIGIVTTD